MAAAEAFASPFPSYEIGRQGARTASFRKKVAGVDRHQKAGW